MPFFLFLEAIVATTTTWVVRGVCATIATYCACALGTWREESALSLTIATNRKVISHIALILSEKSIVGRYEALGRNERLAVSFAGMNPAERTHEVALTMTKHRINSRETRTIHDVPKLSLCVRSIEQNP